MVLELRMPHKPFTKEVVDTIIISDVHFGSELSLSTTLRLALERFSFKRLILNGDIFEHLNFEPRISMRPINQIGYERKNRLNKNQFELIKEILALGKKSCEVVWIEGNHDDGLNAIFSSLMGVTVLQEYMWDYGGKHHLALHGDQFDHFLQTNPFISYVATLVYEFIQSFGEPTKRFCWFLKRTTKKYNRAISSVGDNAIRYARSKGADYVFCGHTHYAEQRLEDDVRYYNSGSWTEAPCHLITIGEKGVQIHAFSEHGEWEHTLSPADGTTDWYLAKTALAGKK